MPHSTFLATKTVPSLEELLDVYDSLSAAKWHTGSDAAQVVANYLACHPKVLEVRYPGLKTDPAYTRASQVLYGGFGPYVWYKTRATSDLLDCTNCDDVKAFILSLEEKLR